VVSTKSFASRIVDHRLAIRLDLDTPVKGNTLFQANPSIRGYLANQLLTYDALVVPTKDFGNSGDTLLTLTKTLGTP